MTTVIVGTLYNRTTKDFYKGTSFRERGDWEANNHYFHDEYNIDYVRFQGCLLECVKSHFSNSSNYPVFIFDEGGNPTGLVDETYWKLVLASLKGTIGPVGPTGPTGPTGPQGPRGYNGSVDNFVVLSEEEWEELVGIDPNKFYYVYEDIIEPESFYAYVEGETLNIKGDIEIFTLELDEHYCSWANDRLTIVAGANAPVFSKPGGSYNNPITVSISSSTVGSEIFYTTDGSEPTQESYQYTEPLTISTSTTLKAKAYRTGMQESTTSSVTYYIGEQEIEVIGDTLRDSSGTYTNNTWTVNRIASVVNQVLIF